MVLTKGSVRPEPPDKSVDNDERPDRQGDAERATTGPAEERRAPDPAER